MAQARSSGGYSRPSSGGYSRTPSFGGSSTPRTPSFGGGGYTRGGGSIFGQSSGDRGFSQDRSGNALGQYRQEQELSRRQREYQPAPVPQQPSYTPNYGPPGGYYRDSRGRFESRQNWYADRGWAHASTAILQ